MRIARLKQKASLGPSLLDRRLDKLVDELRDNEAQKEEHTLQLAAENEVGDEAAESDEDRD